MFQFVKKLIISITLNRVFMWLLAGAASVVFFTVYENRSGLFSADTAVINPVGFTFYISTSTQQQVNNQVIADSSIVGISIMSADLRLNEARSIFLFSDDALLIEIDSAARRAGTNRMPLFGDDSDSNAHIIALINGESACVQFSSTLFAKIYPQLKNSIKMVCSSSIPAYYGYFSGFVQYFVNENLSLERQSQLKLTAENLATEVYFRDVIPTQKQERASEVKTPFTPR